MIRAISHGWKGFQLDKYRTKPFEIEAVQWVGQGLEVLVEQIPGAGFKRQEDKLYVWDYLQKTWVQVNPYDYIIKGMKGEFYPCDPDVFEAKYEGVI